MPEAAVHTFVTRFVVIDPVNVVTRLLGMLLAALSVQFVLDGFADLGIVGG